MSNQRMRREPLPIAQAVLWAPAGAPPPQPLKQPHPIFLHQKPLRQLLAHTRTSADKTLLGLLLGSPVQDPESGIAYVVVDQMLRVDLEAQGDHTAALMAQLWPRLQEKLKGQETVPVGWYHSHPTQGLVLSAEDVETQTRHFSEPWHAVLLMATEGGKPVAGWYRVTPDPSWSSTPLPFYEVVAPASVDPSGKKRSFVDWANYKGYKALPAASVSEAPPRRFSGATARPVSGESPAVPPPRQPVSSETPALTPRSVGPPPPPPKEDSTPQPEPAQATAPTSQSVGSPPPAPKPQAPAARVATPPPPAPAAPSPRKEPEPPPPPSMERLELEPLIPEAPRPEPKQRQSLTFIRPEELERASEPATEPSPPPPPEPPARSAPTLRPAPRRVQEPEPAAPPPPPPPPPEPEPLLEPVMAEEADWPPAPSPAEDSPAVPAAAERPVEKRRRSTRVFPLKHVVTVSLGVVVVLGALAGAWALGFIPLGGLGDRGVDAARTPAAPVPPAREPPATPPPQESPVPAVPLDPAMTALDALADSVAVSLRVYRTRQTQFTQGQTDCAMLGRALSAVEGHWINYNVQGKPRELTLDAARAARDRSMYADIDAVENHFDSSACPRP